MGNTPKWTGSVVSKMHLNGITFEDIGEKLGVSKAYVGMILNGKRTPPDAEARVKAALEEIIKERN